MRDLHHVAQAILVYTVLGAGILATLLTGFAQLRELPRALKSGPSAALVRRGFLAASVGMGSIGGTLLALELGGPGAIAWMWIAALLGMGLVHAEVRLSARFRRTGDGPPRAGIVYAMAEGIPVVRGPVGAALATLVLAVLSAGFVAGLLWVGWTFVAQVSELPAPTPQQLLWVFLGSSGVAVAVLLAASKQVAPMREDVQAMLSGKTLALVYALVFMVFALAAGSVLQTQQSGVLLETVGADRFLIAGFLVIAAAIGMLVPKLRNFVVALGPVAVALYVIALVLIIARAPGSAGGALSQIFAGMFGGGAGAADAVAGGIAGGGVLMAFQVGFLRGTLATEAGLGSAGFTPQADAVKDPKEAAAAAMLAPLVSGIVVPTLTAIVALTSTPWVGQRIDEAGERVEAAVAWDASEAELAELAVVLADGDPERLSLVDKRRVMALWAPLERPQSRGTAASLQAGQTIVLPLDAVAPEGAGPEVEAMRVNHVYPMVMRANPRGMRIPVEQGSRAIVMPLSEQSQVIGELVFRDRDPVRGQFPAYDRRIPVHNEVFGTEDIKFVRLTPVDDDIDLYRMSKVREGPYAVFGDFHFEARVVKMFHNRWGVHHALIEIESETPGNMNLRSAVASPAFRGPYLDNGDARPPLAMVAREGFDAPVGARMQMEYRAPVRGLEVGKLLTSGEFIAPPWAFLAETKVAVLRHKTDPTQDIQVPVTHSVVDGNLRFLSANRDKIDFSKADRWAEYTGPYLLPPPYRFEVEVHTAARFPASSALLSRLGLERTALAGPLSDRRTLVAVNDAKEPVGSRGQLYDPHPAEVAPFMDGPWVSGEGLERIGWASRLDTKRGTALLLAISVLILALTTMIAWAGYGARAADFVFGHGGGLGFRIVFCVLGLAGATLTILPVIRLADYMMIGLLVFNGLAVVTLLIRERTRAA